MFLDEPAVLGIDQYHQEIILGEFGETVYNFWEMVLFGALNDLKHQNIYLHRQKAS